MKDWVYRIRQWLAHKMCMWAVSLDTTTFLRRAHIAVCHAAFKAALDAGATGDLTVRIIVEEDKGDPDFIDEWEMDDMPHPTTETFH